MLKKCFEEVSALEAFTSGGQRQTGLWIGRSTIHPSHATAWYRGVAICTHCGAYCSWPDPRVRELKRGCRGYQMPDRYVEGGKANLQRMRSGFPPNNLKRGFPLTEEAQAPAKIQKLRMEQDATWSRRDPSPPASGPSSPLHFSESD